MKGAVAAAGSHTVAAWRGRGRDAHPGVEVEHATFARFVEAAMAAEPDPDETADELPVADLYLACACAAGAPGAAARFEALYGGLIRRALGRVLSNPADCEEAVQRAEQMLLAGTPPKIAQYRGRSRLAQWAAVAAIRVAVSTGRSESPDRRLRQKLMAGAIGATTQSPLIRAERARIEHAIGEAVGRLDSRDRLVLRLHLLGGISVPTIGRIFGVNQTTMGHELRRVYDRLLEEIRRSLAEICAGESELASILQIVGSQLDLSTSCPPSGA